MRIQFNNTDSTGKPATKRLQVEYDGEYYELEPNDRGLADVPRSVGKHLAESKRTSITLPDQARPDEPGPPDDPQPQSEEEAARELIESMEREQE